MQMLEGFNILNFRNGWRQSVGKLPETNLQRLDHALLASFVASFQDCQGFLKKEKIGFFLPKK